MNVLILTPFYPPLVSGAGAYTADAANGLIAAGHRVTVVLGQGGPCTAGQGAVRVETVHGKVRGTTSFLMLRRALAIHRRDHFDLVVAAPAYPIGVVALIVAQLIGRPLIVVAFGEDVSISATSSLARWSLRRVFAAARHVIVASSFTRTEVFALGVCSDKVSIVAPCIDATPFLGGSRDKQASRRRFGVDGHVILTVARLEERKGHDIVLQAIHLLTPEFDNLQYLVIGLGDPTRLRTLAARWQINDRLTIVDYLAEDELPEAYAAADIYAMASRPGPSGEVEGFGIVYLEAAASGLPCVGGVMGGCSDAVVDGVTGWCVDPHDPQAVAAALRSMLTSPQTARQMGERGRRRVLANYQRASMQIAFTGILERAADMEIAEGDSEFVDQYCEADEEDELVGL